MSPLYQRAADRCVSLGVPITAARIAQVDHVLTDERRLAADRAAAERHCAAHDEFPLHVTAHGGAEVLNK